MDIFRKASILIWNDVRRCWPTYCGPYLIRMYKYIRVRRTTLKIISLFLSGRHRTVPISLLEFKQLMLIMCNTQTFDQMILEEFLIVADHNRCVNRFRFESLLKVISKIFSFLGESAHYGWHLVTDWVQQCFQQVNRSNEL